MSERLYLGLFCIIAGVAVWQAIKIGDRGKHRRNVRKAGRVLQKLRGFDHDGAVISYLRKIDPFVFEELLLSSFASRGINITRNRRYTGDGGIDGRIVVDGRVLFIQAKRYAGAVSTLHIRDFSAICSQSGVSGLFIHTGRTPKHARGLPRNVTLVSGSKLAALIKSSSPLTWLNMS